MRKIVLLVIVAAGLGTSACIVDLGPFGKQECGPKQVGPNHVDANTIVCVPLR